jgi:cytochrome c oxidase assembly factor CtaG
MDVFNRFVLTAHMLQHMTLMMVAPPLILLGEPLVPMVRGLPRFAAREFAGPLLNWTPAQRVGRVLISPLFALVLMGLVNFAWHTPRLYQLALDSDSWHQTEHACFFLTSLLFWWPVVQPWPSQPQWPRWAMVPYLLLADLQNTTLSAILVFSDRVLYPWYLDAPRLFGFSAQQDQVAAGAIMWVVGSLAFVVPAVIISVRCLSRRNTMPAINSRVTDDSVAARMLGSVESGLPFRFFAARLRSRFAQAMTFTFLFGVTGLCFAYLLAAPVDDDQVLRWRGQSDHFDVAVYGPGGDIPIGSTAFSVLVQDRTTQETLLDSEVDFALQTTGPGRASPVKLRANREASENKLLESGEVELSAAGDWTLNVLVQYDAARSEFSLPLHVVKPQSGDVVRWPYMDFAATSLILLMIYFWRHRVPAKYPPKYLNTSV